MEIALIIAKGEFCEALTRGADALALADAGERAEVREAEPSRGREGAHGRSEGRSFSLVAAASAAAPAEASRAISVSSLTSSKLMKSATPTARTETTLRSWIISPTRHRLEERHHGFRLPGRVRATS